MNQERSVRRATKRNPKSLGIGAIGAFAVTGLIFAIPGSSDRSGQAVASQSPARRAEPSNGGQAPATAPGNVLRARSTELGGPSRRSTGEGTGVKRRAVSESSVSAERARLVRSAHRELEQLELQEPHNFLALFDMMLEEEQGKEKIVEVGRNASHVYILARMRILERMLCRFIDDPESDHTLEIDALVRGDADFKQTIDGLAREIPTLAGIPDLLTSTTLKAPAFLEQTREAP